MDIVTKAFKYAKSFSPSVHQYYNQYQFVHRRTVHTKLLYKMVISETATFLFCNN